MVGSARGPVCQVVCGVGCGVGCGPSVRLCVFFLHRRWRVLHGFYFEGASALVQVFILKTRPHAFAPTRRHGGRIPLRFCSRFPTGLPRVP